MQAYYTIVICYLLAVPLVQTWYDKKYVKREVIKKSYGHQGIWWRLSLIAFLFGLYSIYFLRPGWMPHWMLVLEMPVQSIVRVVGVVVMTFGVMSFTWSQVTLGKNWSGEIRIKRGHELVTEGPYNWVRHPMYSAFIIIVVGTFLTHFNILIGIVSFVWLWLIIRRYKIEERLMLEEFDKDYKIYKKRTGRFFPRLRSPER